MRPAPKDDPDLKSKWVALRREYFPEREDLDSYAVYWSSRDQKRTLAVCNIERRRVIVARELRVGEYEEWLSPLLYHELCHAVIGKDVPRRERGRAWHGPEFKALEKRHPGIRALNKWIRDGGWTRAVRSDRSRRAHARRRERAHEVMTVDCEPS